VFAGAGDTKASADNRKYRQDTEKIKLTTVTPPTAGSITLMAPYTKALAEA
jgi:hypothetical protein